VDFLDPSAWKKLGFSPMSLRMGETSAERIEARQDATEADAMRGNTVTMNQLGDTDGSNAPLPLPARHLSESEPEESDRAIAAYLDRTLAKIRQFRSEMSQLYDASKASQYPPLVVMSSTSTATVSGCIVESDEDIIDGRYDRLLFAEGGKCALLRNM
jgi:hypothetical protein